jgi:two-component system, chemotaxis family, protein-glutamate methylesterase/glutaminase
MPDGYVLDKPLSLSCPECGGVLRPDNRGGIKQFRCHIGHALTAETVLVAQFSALEKKLAGSLALLNERAELCQQMGEDARKDGDGTSGFEAAAREALARAQVIKRLLEEEWMQPVGDVAPDRPADHPERSR